MSRYVLQLKIVNESVRSYYENAVTEMQKEEYLMNHHKDSGFDIYIPWNENHKIGTIEGSYSFENNQTKLIDLGIQCAAYHYFHDTFQPRPQPFYIYPRSSISKTRFRLANNVGIVDSGYRGNLKVALDNINGDIISLSPFNRLVQICMPNLEPFQVEIVDELDETARGSSGFGSTGE